MHRPLRHLLLSTITALAALLPLACTDDPPPPDEPPTATATATPSSTPRRTPTPIITTVTPAPTPFPDPPPLAPQPATSELEAALRSSDTLVVVSGEVRSTRTASRAWPTIAVTTLDSAGDQLARLEFGSVDRFPHRWDLAGDEVIVAFEYAIVRYRLDGTIATVLRPEGELGYQELLVSPDGARIVFAEVGNPDCGVACVVFADARTGNELGRIPQLGPTLVELPRFPAPSAWRGNDSVLVRGRPNGHAAHGLATANLNGTVEIHPTDPTGTFAPNGNQILRWAGTVEGYDNAPMTCGLLRGFDIYDIDSGAIVASSRSTTAGISNARWSPDGAEILVGRKSLPDPDEVPCDGAYWVWWNNPVQWSLFNLDTDREQAIADPLVIWQRWYGQPFADLTCLTGRAQLIGSESRSQRVQCLDDKRQELPETTLRLNGTPIATGPYDRVLGVLPPSAELTPEELHALPPDTRFGEADVDAIIDALLAADVDTVMHAIQWQQLPCAINWTGGPPSPTPCTASEVDGTLVDALPLGGSELQHDRPDAIRTRLERELPRSRALCELQTHDDSKRVIRLRLATVYRGQPTTAVTDDLTFTIIDGHIVSVGNLIDPGHRDSARCPGVRDLTTN